MKPLLPGETWIGILGGGQLGRMLTMEARRMGYQVIQWAGSSDQGPAELADEVLTEPFDCPDGLERFLSRVDAATVEFENIPRALLDAVAERVPMAPSPEAVYTCQHREREKRFLTRHGFPCAWHAEVDSADALEQALASMPAPEGILKTAEFGYDGKGQIPLRRELGTGSVAEAWKAMGSSRAVLEEKIVLEAEASVLVARDRQGNAVVYDPAENQHRRHILDLSIVPARLPEEVRHDARELALAIAAALDYTGVLAVEFFLAPGGRLLVNELAPRPHNSGHHTLDVCETSQFEQQLRALCGLPLGGSGLLSPAVMWNLLGDLWDAEGNPPDWRPVFSTPGAKLHLYGKRHARPGRKMGHVTFSAPRVEDALARAEACRDALARGD